MNDDLQGRVALVTGASRGIGRGIARALAAAGCRVAVHYHQRAADAEAVAAQTGGIALQGNVALSADVTRVVAGVEQQLGPIDILINNAGIARVQPIDEITEADFDELIAVNLKSCFLMTQAVLPGMRARKWGRIVNLSSVAAQTGGVVGPHYAASKAGMLGLTRAYASRLAKEGITVNAIAPALIETEMVTNNLNARPDLIPVGRFGTVEETAEVALMLVRNAYITGQTFNVNGGWYLS